MAWSESDHERDEHGQFGAGGGVKSHDEATTFHEGMVDHHYGEASKAHKAGKMDAAAAHRGAGRVHDRAAELHRDRDGGSSPDADARAKAASKFARKASTDVAEKHGPKMGEDRAGLAYDRLAFDRSNRYLDADGRLHVRVSHISKANVCPYQGAEIPDFERLGLDPAKIYNLLRDPEELAKAAATFNNVPLLDRHIAVTAQDPKKDRIVGSTGTDAAFNAPYLDNSLVVWDASAIAGIDSEDPETQVKELSSAYRYVADMTPGTYEGLTFDGVMRQIKANHVALVQTGRAGPDVIVGDAAPKRGFQGVKVNMKLNSRKALMVHGALCALVAPKLATDAKVDFGPALKGVTAKNFASKKDGIYTGVVRATKGKLAADAELSDVIELLDNMEKVEGEPGVDDMIVDPAASAEAALDTDDDVVAKIMAFLKGKLNDDDMAALTALAKPQGAMDDPPSFEGEPDTKAPKVDKPAMDAAIKSASDKARTDAVAAMTAIRTAERDVRPYIGELAVAMDSADAIYRKALEAFDVDVTGVHPSAFPAMLKLVPVPGARRVIAADAAPDADFHKRFPGAARIKQG